MGQREFFVRKASGLVREVSGTDALMLNVASGAPMLTFIFINFAGLLYPGVDMALGTLLAIALTFVIALAYYFMSVAMPRSGGDFVWVSRSLHPAVGFMESFLWVVITLSFLGPIGAWVLDPGLTSTLVNWGTLTNNPALISYAKSLVTPLNMVISSLIVTVVACGVHFFKIKMLMRFYLILFFVALVGSVAFWGSMLAIGHDGFVARFNSLSGTNYFAIIKAAQSAGYDTGFTVFGTLLGSVFAFLNLVGYQWSTYVGGEIKNVSRSQAIGILGEILIMGSWGFTTYTVAYAIAGREFINAASYVALSGNSAWSLPLNPTLAYLAVFANYNPWIAILPAIGLVAGVFAVSSSWITMSTRVFFAWSFDRLLPTRISAVDSRFNAPRNAVIMSFIIGVIYVLLNYYTGLLSFLSYGTMGTFLAITIVGLSITVFPYVRKDIFEKAPALVRVKVANVPAMTILGCFTVIVNGFVTAFSVAPVVTGAPVNPIYVTAIFVTLFAGLLIYGIAYWYNRRLGIDMRMGFREIPPL